MLVSDLLSWHFFYLIVIENLMNHNFLPGLLPCTSPIGYAFGQLYATIRFSAKCIIGT